MVYITKKEFNYASNVEGKAGRDCSPCSQKDLGEIWSERRQFYVTLLPEILGSMLGFDRVDLIIGEAEY